jgi:hypothetical protein
MPPKKTYERRWKRNPEKRRDRESIMRRRTGHGKMQLRNLN